MPMMNALTSGTMDLLTVGTTGITTQVLTLMVMGLETYHITYQVELTKIGIH